MRDFPLNPENQKPNSDISKLRQYGQDKQFTLIQETVTETMIGEREIVIEKVGANIKICTKISGTVYKTAALT